VETAVRRVGPPRGGSWSPRRLAWSRWSQKTLGQNESEEWSYLKVVEKTALEDVITSTKVLPSVTAFCGGDFDDDVTVVAVSWSATLRGAAGTPDQPTTGRALEPARNAVNNQ
jgi:hypothetical protein